MEKILTKAQHIYRHKATEIALSGMNLPGTGDPSNVAEFAQAVDDILAGGIRPLYTPTDTPNNLYFSPESGNDTTGDGSQGSPYKTLAKCITRIGLLNSSVITIWVMGTDVAEEIDAQISFLSFVTIRGVVEAGESREIDTVVFQSNTRGVSFTVTGATLADDAWQGRLLRVTGTASDMIRVWVYGNRGNTIYGVVHNASTNSDNQTGLVDTASVELINQPKIDIASSDIGTQATFQLNFIDLEIEGNGWFFQSTDKVELRRCNIKNNFISAGRAGGLSLLSSYIQPTVGGTSGSVRARSGGDLRIGRGCIFDATNTSGSKSIDIREASTLTFIGGTMFHNCAGIRFDESFAFPIIDATALFNLCLQFELDTTPTCTAFLTANGDGTVQGGWANIPAVHGEIANDYLVTAQFGAHVKLDNTSNVITDTVPNAVSADAGTTACSRAVDGTEILNGTPAYPVGWNALVLTALDDYYFSPATANVIGVDVTTGNKNVHLPASASTQQGTEVIITDYLGVASASNAIYIVPNGADSVAGVAAPYWLFSTNGRLRLCLIGTNWHVLSA